MLVCIPQPRDIEVRPGALAFAGLSLIFLPPDAEPLDLAAAALLREEIVRLGGPTLPISRAWRPVGADGVLALGDPASLLRAFGRDLHLPAVPADPEGYSLAVTPQGAALAATTARGRLWAAQTFRQLLRVYGAMVPCVRVIDAPVMRYRGVLLDVSRRKVPTLETLYRLVDTLSLLKLNMLQLQVEHTFRFLRHPRIGAGCGSVTGEELLALDAHCQRRGVELVPMLQSFGHMRNILMLEEYAHLAEHPAAQWSLCPTDLASLQFMDELYEEFLPCFSSPRVNIGCDETVDLGKQGGRSTAVVRQKGTGRVYLDFLLALHALLTEKFGKQVMCWGDVVLNHPELVPELPKDLIVLNWDYEAKPHYPQVEVFAQSGLPQIICPGTSAWNGVFPRLNNAWENVHHFARDGKAAGALGLLNTDWGDGGHYNLLGNSLYSYAHGADVSWAATPLLRPSFDTLLGPVLFGTLLPDGVPADEPSEAFSRQGEGIVHAIRELGSACDGPQMRGVNCNRTMQCLFSSPMETPALRALPAELLDELLRVAVEAGAVFHAAAPASLEASAVADMAWAADAVAYAARKTAFLCAVLAVADGRGDAAALAAADGRGSMTALEVADDRGDMAALVGRGEELLAEHEATVAAFRERWFAGNRHAEIEVALERFAHAGRVLRAAGDWLAAGDVTIPLVVPPYQPPWKENFDMLWGMEEEAVEA